MNFDFYNFGSSAEENNFYGIDTAEHFEAIQETYDNFFSEIDLMPEHEANQAS